MAKKSLKEQAKEILRLAEESGLQSNYFFVTTFERYQHRLCRRLCKLCRRLQSGSSRCHYLSHPKKPRQRSVGPCGGYRGFDHIRQLVQCRVSTPQILSALWSASGCHHRYGQQNQWRNQVFAELRHAGSSAAEPYQRRYDLCPDPAAVQKSGQTFVWKITM